MPHEYKVGDKVRIKERESKSNDYPFGFAGDMASLKGKIFIIEQIFPCSQVSLSEYKYYNEDCKRYVLKNSVFSWHSSMFEPAEETIKKDSYERDIVQFGSFKGDVSETTRDGKKVYFLYLFSGNYHPSICESLYKLPWFESLAKKYNALDIEKLNVFPKFYSLEDLYSFIREANYYFSLPEKESSQKIDKQYENNAIKFQRSKASLVRGSVPEGHRICGRRNKTAISIGHLSNRACNF